MKPSALNKGLNDIEYSNLSVNEKEAVTRQGRILELFLVEATVEEREIFEKYLNEVH